MNAGVMAADLKKAGTKFVQTLQPCGIDCDLFSLFIRSVTYYLHQNVYFLSVRHSVTSPTACNTSKFVLATGYLFDCWLHVKGIYMFRQPHIQCQHGMVAGALLLTSHAGLPAGQMPSHALACGLLVLMCTLLLASSSQGEDLS